MTKDVRGELDWIVMKCLEKDRTRRYETANGLAQDVERHLHDEPVEAGPPSTSYKLKKLARKHRRLLTTAAAFLLLMMIGVVVSSWLAVWASQAEGLAQQRLKDVTAEQEKTKQALAAETKARQQTREALNSMTDEVIETLFAKQPQLGENEKAFLRKVLGFYEAFAADGARPRKPASWRQTANSAWPRYRPFSARILKRQPAIRRRSNSRRSSSLTSLGCPPIARDWLAASIAWEFY